MGGRVSGNGVPLLEWCKNEFSSGFQCNVGVLWCTILFKHVLRKG